jgi:hypothetical protein
LEDEKPREGQNKTKVYIKHKDGKSGDVRSIKTLLRPFNYENEMLEGGLVHVEWVNIDFHSREFCSLCWRRTERFSMKIQMAKVASENLKRVPYLEDILVKSIPWITISLTS